MRRLLLLGVVAALVGCGEPAPRVHTEIKEDGTKVEYVERSGSGGGVMEHMAGAAVAGAAAGAAGAAAHRVTDHAINRFQERREQRRAAPSPRTRVGRNSNGFRGRR